MPILVLLLLFALCQSEKLLEFSKDCQHAIGGYKIHSIKNLQKPLHGSNIRISLDPAFKDSLKKKQCLIIDQEILEITTNFINDLPHGETSVLYKNHSRLFTSLDKHGNIDGILKFYSVHSGPNPSFLGHAKESDKWMFHLEFWLYSRSIDDVFQVIASTNFTQFYACKYVDTTLKLAQNCLEIQLKNNDGFHYVPQDFTINHRESALFADINLSNWIIYHHHKEPMYRQKACNQNNLKNWQVIMMNESKPREYRMADSNLDPKDLLTSFQDVQILMIDMKEFARYDKDAIPTVFKITQNGKEILKGHLKVSENHQGIIDLNSAKVEVEKSPISLVLYLGLKSMDIPSVTIIGHLCKCGTFCGLVKKYGIRLRDPLCTNHLPDQLSYVGFHDPQSGEPIGSTYHFLLGSSILYSANGGIFPSNETAYIYFGSQTSIYGSFDESKILIKGQKVPFEKIGCDANGLPILQFLKPTEPHVFYHYKPPNSNEFGDQPTVPDEVATDFVYVKKINDFKGDGVFAQNDIENNTAVAQYGGVRGHPWQLVDPRIEGNPYGHRIGFCPNFSVNIPMGFTDILKYNATMAHKTNNHFASNLRTTQVDSARFGLIGMFITKKSVKKDQELTSFYDLIESEDYPLPKWYIAQLEDFNKMTSFS